VRALAWAAMGLARTWRVEICGDERVTALRAAKIPVVFAVWHGRLFPPLWHRRHEGIALLVSQHRDGGYLAHAAARWGYRVFRGSSTRGGAAGLRRIVRALRKGGDAAFAADGPRGPREVAKPGAIAAARMAGAAVVPVGVGALQCWRLGSWDRMQVPAPGTRVRIVYGEPLMADVLEEGTAALSHALRDAGHQASW
jgi:lysophospholipid acyltransferase (LPLAT)-like uncharacterized protein